MEETITKERFWEQLYNMFQEGDTLKYRGERIILVSSSGFPLLEFNESTNNLTTY